MKAFWRLLLEKAIAALLGGDWILIRSAVESLLGDPRAGAEKRSLVFSRVRMAGSTAATWLIFAAIEVAYGRFRESKETQ